MADRKRQNLNRLFTEQYEKYSDAIFRYAYFQTSSRDKAFDFTQEAYLKTWEYLLEGHRVENLRAFIYKVTRNLIIDERRKKKAESLDQMQEAGFDISTGTDEHEARENAFDAGRVLEVINGLELKHREIIMLRLVEGFGVQEIAVITGDSPNNVSVKVHRASERLRKLLEETEKRRETKNKEK